MFGSAGTKSRARYPLPAVKLAGFAVEVSPSTRSPFAVVMRMPLLGDASVPWPATAAPSSEFAIATPEYSRMAYRMVPVMVSDTVIVFAPPAMFSA